MDWADELAASVQGPQVVNDSKTPSGTVHVGSLRGPVILDVITRALRARGLPDDAPLRRRRHGPDGRPGAAHPGRHRALHGRPAGPDPRPGRRLPRLVRPASRPDVHRPVLGPRDPPRPLLLDERHLPDRGDGPLHPDGARQGRRRARHLPSRGERPAPRRLAAGRRRLPQLRAGRARRSRPTGTARRWRSPAAPTSWRGPRAAGGRAGSRRSAPPRSCPGTSSGPRSGACSASRSSPTARTWRPRAGHATGRTRSRARSTSASRRSTSPTSSSTSRGRKMSTSKGLRGRRAPVHRDRAAGADALPVRPPPPGERHRVRPGGHRRRPAPVRRVRPARCGHRRPRRQGRAAVGLRLDLPLLAPGSRGGRGAGRGRVPAGVRPPRAARPGPGRGRRRARRVREGRPADGRRGRRVRGPPRRRPALAGGVRPRTLPDRDPPRRAAGRGGPAPARAARLPAGAGRGRARRRAGDRRAVAGRDLRGGDRPRHRRQGGVHRPVPRVPRPAQRPARGLAAGEPAARLRRPAAPRGRAS